MALSWSVCEQPWQDGDLLMAQISESAENLLGVTNNVSRLGAATATPECLSSPEAADTPAPTATSELAATQPQAPLAPPPAPQNLTATANDDGTVTLIREHIPFALNQW